jgi:hypothetical protein
LRSLNVVGNPNASTTAQPSFGSTSPEAEELIVEFAIDSPAGQPPVVSIVGPGKRADGAGTGRVTPVNITSLTVNNGHSKARADQECNALTRRDVRSPSGVRFPGSTTP